MDTYLTSHESSLVVGDDDSLSNPTNQTWANTFGNTSDSVFEGFPLAEGKGKKEEDGTKEKSANSDPVGPTDSETTTKVGKNRRRKESRSARRTRVRKAKALESKLGEMHLSPEAGNRKPEKVKYKITLCKRSVEHWVRKQGRGRTLAAQTLGDDTVVRISNKYRVVTQKDRDGGSRCMRDVNHGNSQGQTRAIGLTTLSSS